MRLGCYEILLTGDENQLLTEFHIGGATIVSAESFKSFKIILNIHRKSIEVFPSDFIHVRVIVDEAHTNDPKAINLFQQAGHTHSIEFSKFFTDEESFIPFNFGCLEKKTCFDEHDTDIELVGMSVRVEIYHSLLDFLPLISLLPTNRRHYNKNNYHRKPAVKLTLYCQTFDQIHYQMDSDESCSSDSSGDDEN
jgi:hypothetical protein